MAQPQGGATGQDNEYLLSNAGGVNINLNNGEPVSYKNIRYIPDKNLITNIVITKEPCKRPPPISESPDINNFIGFENKKKENNCKRRNARRR